MSLEEFSLQLYHGQYYFEMSHDRIKAIIEGLLRNYWLHIAFADEDKAEEERAIGTEKQARYLWNHYTQEMATSRNVLALPPFDEMKKTVLDDMLRSGAVQSGDPDAIAREAWDSSAVRRAKAFLSAVVWQRRSGSGNPNSFVSPQFACLFLRDGMISHEPESP